MRKIISDNSVKKIEQNRNYLIKYFFSIMTPEKIGDFVESMNAVISMSEEAGVTSDPYLVLGEAIQEKREKEKNNENK